MGITGEIVRSVFSNSRSVRNHHGNVRGNNSLERSRWSLVRAYLCGDECNSNLKREDSATGKSSMSMAAVAQLEFCSVMAEEDLDSARSGKGSVFQQHELGTTALAAGDDDSASIRGSESTVTQPIREELSDTGHVAGEGMLQQEKQNSTAKLFRRDDAATVIQTAFRAYLARCRNEKNGSDDDDDDDDGGDCGEETVIEMGSPGLGSVGTSVEVQTGNSTHVFSFHDGTTVSPHRVHHRAKAQVLKLQEEWDDSTVSSNVLKMRIQNKTEAATRRERALAYAFSQQLRLCSKKKQARPDGTEQDMGWSWLDRWMATRQTESSLLESHVTKKPEPNNSNQKTMVTKRLLEFAMEEKESCGSNEVSLQIDNIPFAASEDKSYFRPSRKAPKPKGNVTRRKLIPREHKNACKKDSWKGECKDKKQKVKQQPAMKRETTGKDEALQELPELVTNNNPKPEFLIL